MSRTLRCPACHCELDSAPTNGSAGGFQKPTYEPLLTHWAEDGREVRAVCSKCEANIRFVWDPEVGRYVVEQGIGGSA